MDVIHNKQIFFFVNVWWSKRKVRHRWSLELMNDDASPIRTNPSAGCFSKWNRPKLIRTWFDGEKWGKVGCSWKAISQRRFLKGGPKNHPNYSFESPPFLRTLPVELPLQLQQVHQVQLQHRFAPTTWMGHIVGEQVNDWVVLPLNGLWSPCFSGNCS